MELGEPVSRVLNEIDPLKSRFLSNSTLALTGLRPRGHPSSCKCNVKRKSNMLSENIHGLGIVSYTLPAKPWACVVYAKRD